MQVFDLNDDNIPMIAKLMSDIKPEWWDYEGAFKQLSDINESIKTKGWYLGDDMNHPKGWILSREFIGYRTLEVECSGFDDNGTFKLEHKLGDLFKVAEEYAKSKGYLTLKSGISSMGFNIHHKEIKDISHSIKTLQSDRIDYKWYLENGFRVIGIQPNAYEKGFHLIMLGKELL